MRKKINLGRVHPLVVDVKELGSRLRGHDDIIQIEGINDGRILILILSFLFSLYGYEYGWYPYNYSFFLGGS